MRVKRDFEINGIKFRLNEGNKFICKSKYKVEIGRASGRERV